MIRSELVGKLAQSHPHLPRPVVGAALNAILSKIMDSLAQGQRVEVRGFGNFSSKVRKARMGRDPRTGAPVAVASKRILHFRASKLLLEQLNHPTTPG
ncbi:HU family DNA-binding protein [Paracoccus nototheniae]|uniref:HU family DNA-binding protein n=1 Tax=Paracoccus nototheniae TaxID=2489002 RepID=A0ABW4E3M0_9RHOB|nr:HU family DNA-binding protein [Paracoccus nototheniae]